LTLFDYCQIN